MMADVCILNVTPDWMDYRLGETILTLNALGMSKGLLVVDEMVDKGMLARVVKGTVVEHYAEAPNNATEIKTMLSAMSIEAKSGSPRVLVDHSFEVKSVGTVALGVVLQGEIKPYDNVVAQPSGKECMIRSIQMQDKDQASAGPKSRVGLALKGVTPEEATRGPVLCAKGDITPKKEFSVNFKANPFFKDKLTEKFMRLCSALQWKQVEVGAGTVKSEQALVAEPGQKVLFARAAKPGEQRIIGWGELR
jgi:selenocysteine-specific translation elongation factor